jgi:fructose-1,6-bisphosphatase/sedoheptulose 1,7-bisphosphatase-like protein
MDIIDVMVHVDEAVSPDKMHELEEAVRGDACVVSACGFKDSPHLLSVTYNPDCTSSNQVLQRVLAQGVHAEIVCL